MTRYLLSLLADCTLKYVEQIQGERAKRSRWKMQNLKISIEYRICLGTSKIVLVQPKYFNLMKYIATLIALFESSGQAHFYIIGLEICNAERAKVSRMKILNLKISFEWPICLGISKIVLVQPKYFNLMKYILALFALFESSGQAHFYIIQT